MQLIINDIEFKGWVISEGIFDLVPLLNEPNQLSLKIENTFWD